MLTTKLAPIKRFWRLLELYKFELRQIYVYAIFIGIVNLTLPLGIQAIINYLQTGEVTSTWMVLVLFVIGGIGITGILQVMQLRTVENIQRNIFARSAFEFAYRLPKISFLQLDKVHAPELVNRFFDTLTLQKGLPKVLIDFSLAIFQITFGLVLLSIYSPYFIILAFVLAVATWVMFKISGPKGLKASIKESKLKYSLVFWLEEVAHVSRSFKLNAKHKFHLSKTDDLVTDYLGKRETYFKIIVNQYKMFIGFKIIASSSLLIMGGLLVFAEKMNIGQFVAAEIIILLVINSAEKIMNSVDSIYDVLTALEKIGDVTDLELDQSNGTATMNQETGMAVKADKINFGLGEPKRTLIKNLSFDIKAGEKIVLKGKSGTGKSLLLHILAGIHHIDSGNLTINGIPYNNYQEDEIYESLGVAFPSNQIFEATFKENILLGKACSQTELKEIIDLLDLQPYLNYQAKGIETMLDSGGRRLPRGIIQKILIARVLVHQPKLLLLEDPLHFLEEEDKKIIVDYIMDKRRDWTVIIVSDYYYWKEKCDRVIELVKN
ncbi:peptidase domain-containing ABC transporter [Labilibacter marinus]|uniref:peptidase domain-containing ABC transporter n=1 Tax=Labilibacter marinus TaxID=1477105 RepID=UPI00082AD016|nr:ATP-binding cassette domain-containing protein [Labilibacter marinus]